MASRQSGAQENTDPCCAMTRRGGGWRCVTSGVLLCAVLAISACSHPQPDLARLYRTSGRRNQHPPVVLIPGMMGSELVHWDTGATVWPGPPLALITGRSLHRIPFPIDGLPPGAIGDELVAGTLFFDIGRHDFYASIVRTLTEIGGYNCVPPAQIDATTDCVLFSWDWRRSFVEASDRLGKVIARLQRLRGDPELQVDIVAHSAGGLVARYYLRYGGRPLEASGWNRQDHNVRRFVMIGTPNFGATAALQQAMIGTHIGMGLLHATEIATMPAMPQLFPHPRHDWMVDIDGQPVDLDVFDITLWEEMHWGIFSPDEARWRRRQIPDAAARARFTRRLRARFAAALRDGRLFAERLDRPLTDTSTEYITFGGDCLPTPSRCLIEPAGDTMRLRIHPREIRHPREGVDYDALMLAPGDGSVTRDSLLGRTRSRDGVTVTAVFPVSWSLFLCETHERLPRNITFRNNLLNALLR